MNDALATRCAGRAAVPECAADGRCAVVELAAPDYSGPAAVVVEHVVAACSGPAVAVAEHVVAACSGPAALVAEHVVVCSGPAAVVAERVVAARSGPAVAVAEHVAARVWLARACSLVAEDDLAFGPAARAASKQEQRFLEAKSEWPCW